MGGGEAMGVDETVVEWGMQSQIGGRKNTADMGRPHAGAALLSSELLSTQNVRFDASFSLSRWSASCRECAKLMDLDGSGTINHKIGD